MIKGCVQKEIDGNEEAVNSWLSADILKPKKITSPNKKPKKNIKKKGGETLRAEKPLKAVLSRIIEALKKRALTAYFKAVIADMNNLSQRQVLQFLANNAYTDSEDGQKTICDAMVSMYAFLGGLHRVVKAQLVRNGRVVRASIGFYALASCFVRYYLECVKAGNVNKPRTGSDPGWYVRWRAELIRVDKFLEKDNEPHNGLALTDGQYDNRATISTEEDDQVSCWYGAQLDREVDYPTRLVDAIADENRNSQK